MRLAIIIPLANEEQTVPELLRRVTAKLGPDDAVFCIVDTVSKDDTRGAVERFAKANEKQTNKNKKKSNAQRPTSNAQRPTSNAQRPTSNAQRPTSNAQRPTSNVQRPTSNVQRLTENPPPDPSATTFGYPAVHCVWAPENRCVVDAYFRGYRAAFAADAQWILEMDGGLSHRPEEIPRFVEAMQSGVDFAAGSRFIEGSHYHESRLARWLTSRGGTWVSNFLLGTKMKDMTSGFECFSREAMKLVLSRGVTSKAHFFQTEIRYLMHSLNWIEVPITYSCPSNSVGKDSLMDALKCLWHLWRDHRRGNRDNKG